MKTIIWICTPEMSGTIFFFWTVVHLRKTNFFLKQHPLVQNVCDSMVLFVRFLRPRFEKVWKYSALKWKRLGFPWRMHKRLPVPIRLRTQMWAAGVFLVVVFMKDVLFMDTSESGMCVRRSCQPVRV